MSVIGKNTAASAEEWANFSLEEEIRARALRELKERRLKIENQVQLAVMELASGHLGEGIPGRIRALLDEVEVEVAEHWQRSALAAAFKRLTEEESSKG